MNIQNEKFNLEKGSIQKLGFLSLINNDEKDKEKESKNENDNYNKIDDKIDNKIDNKKKVCREIKNNIDNKDKNTNPTDKCFIDKNISENISENINNKLFLLDPLSVIIKLAILGYKPIGTKITIYNNIIYIQEPGIFQGLCRTIMKSNRNDLQYLYNPINIACNYFLHTNYLKKIPAIKNLFICAVSGIKKLMETYNNNTLLNIVLCYYHSLLTNHIEYKELSKETSKDNCRENIDIFYPDNLTNLYNNDLIDNLNKKWTLDKINVILDLISFLLKYKENPNCKSLETIMDSFDIEYQKNIINLLPNT